MRFHYVLTVLFIGSFALLSLTPEQAQGCGPRFYGGPVYYQPMPVYYGYSYYCPPVYYHPRVYYAPPGYSPMRPAPTVTVGAYDDYFRPKTVNVQPGTTVRWVNNGKHIHTVTSKDGRWDSGDIPPGASYTVTFQRPGTYPYYCRHHMQMEGTVVVGPGGGGGSGASDKADNTHVGTFVSAKGTTGFTMADKDGKEHSHTLAPDAKVIGPDGKESKIDALKKGQTIRVTTKEGDLKTATKVEVLKKE